MFCQATKQPSNQATKQPTTHPTYDVDYVEYED